MQQYHEYDSMFSENHIAIDLSEDSAYQNRHKADQNSQVEKVAYMRQIEILQENKKLLSSIKDIYDY